MAVTSHHYYLPMKWIAKQGYPSSVQTPDPVQTSTLWLTGDMRICSLSSWDPHISPHSGAHLFASFHRFASKNSHTHNIIFSQFDVYFNSIHHFTMLVWRSVFSWLAISKKADLWRHNSKQSDLFYSVTGCPACTSPGSFILRWLSLLSLLILLPSLIQPHILVHF